MKLMDKAKQAALAAAVKTGLGYLEKDPEVNIPKLMELVDKFVPDGWYESQRNAIRNAIQNKDSNWYKLILRIYELDPGVREAFFTNFIINASLKGSARQEEVAAQNNCNVPWAILLDPTSACNLHCTGCWAAEYGHKLNLDLETIDSIIRQGKELGVYMYIYTGGEPTVRKKDLIKLCEMHPDCEFLSFSNGTLFDEEFCDEILRVKNFVPAFSLEGSEEANDGRRGEGIYQKVMHAMKLLKEDYAKELEILKVELPDASRIPAVRFDVAKELVAKKYNRQIRNPFDLEPEEEALIGQYFKEEYNADFVFVTHYPSKKRPFYAMDDPEDTRFTLSFDLLFHGLEITTGGQRIHDYNALLKKIEDRGMETEGMEQYLDTFKYGMPPHGGLGIGLERLTMQLLGEENVREACLFPRDLNRLEP